MTNKDKIRAEIERLYNQSLTDENRQTDLGLELCAYISCGKSRACEELLSFVDSLQEEPVSEPLNIESMVESYKQRLMSQTNSMKNSSLVDMCLVSYKHGINETLDTIKLSNIVRIGKNWKEPVSEELHTAAKEYANSITENAGYRIQLRRAVVYGAKWKEEQMMAKAIDAVCFGFQGAAFFSFRLPPDKYLIGSKVKVIVIKED